LPHREHPFLRVDAGLISANFLGIRLSLTVMWRPDQP
jgi:hypothetical protein